MRAIRTSPHFRIEKLGPGIYAAIARTRGYGLCNAGIVDLGGRTVVFDSMLTPMAGADLARAAERCTGRKPDWVVNSHWHGDHIWGNSAFRGGRVVSSRKVRELVLQKSRGQFEECRREFPKELAAMGGANSPIRPADRPLVRAWFRGVLESPKKPSIVPPEVTFGEELVLIGSRRSLHLITYGGGHSPSDVFGYLPEERIIFAGDLAMVGLHPSMSDGWPDRWMRILRRMQRLRPDRVLPGHGPVGPGSTLGVVVRYLSDLDRIALGAVRQGLSLDQVRRVRIPDRYEGWGFSLMFPENVLRAYQLELVRPKVPS
jgi:glyoxylase-like metal-dependent hydrolase (beta-lactamase superfamily II)